MLQVTLQINVLEHTMMHIMYCRKVFQVATWLDKKWVLLPFQTYALPLFEDEMSAIVKLVLHEPSYYDLGTWVDLFCNIGTHIVA